MKKQSMKPSRRGIIKGAALTATGIAIGSGLTSLQSEQAISQTPAQPNPTQTPTTL